MHIYYLDKISIEYAIYKLFSRRFIQHTLQMLLSGSEFQKRITHPGIRYLVHVGMISRSAQAGKGLATSDLDLYSIEVGL